MLLPQLEAQIATQIKVLNALCDEGEAGEITGITSRHVRNVARAAALAYAEVRTAQKVIDSPYAASRILNSSYDALMSCIAQLDAMLDTDYRIKDDSGEVVRVSTTPDKKDMH